VGCGKVKIESAWCAREIVADGQPDEWQGATTYIKETGVAVGVRNDRDNLYVCMSTGDPEIAGSMLRQGFTVWFDPEGGKEKVFGVRCPLGMSGEAPARPPGGEGQRQPSQKTARPDSIDIKDMFAKSSAKIEIHRPDTEGVIRVENNGELGVKVGLGCLRGRYIYEIKVPLGGTDICPYGIGVDMGESIGAGFEIPKVEMAAVGMSGGRESKPTGGGPGGDMPGGGMGGGRGRPPGGGPGGMGGGMGGGRSQGRQSAADAGAGLDLWTKIKLASAE
jgi:hypothetical protein